MSVFLGYWRLLVFFFGEVCLLGDVLRLVFRFAVGALASLVYLFWGDLFLVFWVWLGVGVIWLCRLLLALWWDSKLVVMFLMWCVVVDVVCCVIGLLFACILIAVF